MKTIFHKETSRGHANHGWLNAKHSFSFANFFDPEKIHFGALRVLNDDLIAAGAGFPTHPHQDMEIVTIPLKSSLSHADSEGNKETIHPNEVQVMSAGTGIRHSEFNDSDETTNILQIWIVPDKDGHAPRYDQRAFEQSERVDRMQNLVAPMGSDLPGLKIHQRAYFDRVSLSGRKKLSHKLREPGNGLYVFNIEGQSRVSPISKDGTIEASVLGRRDALGLENIDSIEIEAEVPSDVLLIEVPMLKLA